MRIGTLAWIVTIALVAGAAVAGELYKWVDKDGKVHYSDQPPPPEVKSAERKKLGDKPTEAQLPYSLQRAVKNFPVTLYNAECPDACGKATALLDKRGVPFTNKLAQDAATAEELKALTGGKLVVPVLKVGQQVISGYEEGQWNATLDAAGYPRTPVAPVRPAAPVSKPAKPEQPAQAAPAGEPSSSAQAGSSR